MSLEVKVIHPCPLPEVEDVTSEYRWTCPECGASYSYSWGTAWNETKTTGMLWWRKTEVVREVRPGTWYCTDLAQRVGWEPVDGA